MVLLSLAGAVGAVCRLVLDSGVGVRYGRALPYGTVIVNGTGSLLLGVLTGLVLFHGAPGAVRTVVGTGFCGGYTTFSTASLETVRLLQERRTAAALTSAVGSLLITLLAAGIGIYLTSR